MSEWETEVKNKNYLKEKFFLKRIYVISHNAIAQTSRYTKK